MYKVKEVFTSIQGEGQNAGKVCTFVRFAGCNLNCDFCDTDWSEKDSIEFTEEGLFAIIADHVRQFHLNTTAYIAFTGGEPLLQIDTEFLTRLDAHLYDLDDDIEYEIHTNGSLPWNEKKCDLTFWLNLVVSPKGTVDDLKIEGCQMGELKVVYTGQDLEPFKELGVSESYLQPCWSPNEKARKTSIKLTVDQVMKDPFWKLSLQTHKWIGVR